jgi:Ca-activated chloride channel family protein
MTFEYPWLLLLLLPLALLVWYLMFFQKQPSIRISTLQPMAEASRLNRGGGMTLPVWLMVLGAILLIAAAARPRIGIEQVVIKAQGIDIMLAIDLSGSMQAIDLPQDIATKAQFQQALNSGKLRNRLETAKQELIKFVEKRPTDRIGLTGFAQLPYNISPPTLDHAWLVQHLEKLQPGMIGDATGIAGPIASSVSRLEDSNSKRRVIVLFTDGANNVDARITPRQAAEVAKETGIVIYTVGIGSSQAIVPVSTPFGTELVPVPDSYDEPLLREIAAATGGQFYRAYDAKGLAQVMEEINQMEKTGIEQPKFIDYKEYAPVLAGIALALLLLGFLLNNTVKLRLP